jgi:hypothetical protein
MSQFLSFVHAGSLTYTPLFERLLYQTAVNQVYMSIWINIMSTRLLSQILLSYEHKNTNAYAHTFLILNSQYSQTLYFS